jgi:hypothetical protein
MNINEVIQDGQKYLKLKAGESLIVKFSDNFEKVASKFEDRTSIKYETAVYFRVNGVTNTKVWAGSSIFFETCSKKAFEKGLGFSEASYKVTRIGDGTDTRYEIEVIG